MWGDLFGVVVLAFSLAVLVLIVRDAGGGDCDE